MPRPAESSNVADSLLLDTHIALWLDSGDDHLRTSTQGLIDGCWQHGGTIFLSAVTVWEIALLVDIGRIDLDLPIEAWVERFLERPGVEAVPLGHVPASRAYQFHRLEHRDPADRLLIATAIELACPLVTYDARIARFSRKYGRQYRFAVAA
jgi:PIN domain nuclease of toxin-antitoxin system